MYPVADPPPVPSKSMGDGVTSRDYMPPQTTNLPTVSGVPSYSQKRGSSDELVGGTVKQPPVGAQTLRRLPPQEPPAEASYLPRSQDFDDEGQEDENIMDSVVLPVLDQVCHLSAISSIADHNRLDCDRLPPE